MILLRRLTMSVIAWFRQPMYPSPDSVSVGPRSEQMLTELIPIFLIQSAVGLMNDPKVSDYVYEKQRRYIAFPFTTRRHPLVRSESAALSLPSIPHLPHTRGSRLHRSSPLAHNASSERYCDRAHRKGLTLLVTTPSLNGDVVPIALFLPLLMRQTERSTTATCHRLMTNIPVGCRTDLKAGSSWSRRAALQTATAKLDSTLGMAHDSFQCKIRDGSPKLALNPVIVN